MSVFSPKTKMSAPPLMIAFVYELDPSRYYLRHVRVPNLRDIWTTRRGRQNRWQTYMLMRSPLYGGRSPWSLPIMSVGNPHRGMIIGTMDGN